MSKNKSNNWQDFTLVIAGKEIKGISAVVYDEATEIVPEDYSKLQRRHKYTATLEICKSDYEMLIELTAEKFATCGKSKNKFGYCVRSGGCDMDTDKL